MAEHENVRQRGRLEPRGREDLVADAYPLKRLGVPEDVTGAVSFLLSDDAGWVTGQEFVIDGGITSTGHGATKRDPS